VDISSSIARFRPWRAVIAAALAAGLITAAPVAASTRASEVGGNPDTLSYFEGVVTDWQSVKAARVTEYGLLYLFYNGGTAVNYRWGVTRPPGFKAAKAVINYWLDGGKIVGYLATVTAHDVPRLRILMNSGQVYVSTTNCWDRSGPNGSPFGTGERILVSDSNGNFERIKRTGNANVVTYRYVWSTGSNATQTDTLTLNSPPTIHSKIVVKGKENFKISIINRPLRSRPAFPLKDNSPKPPTPAPLCKKKQT
jgi:hypothetical protein